MTSDMNNAAVVAVFDTHANAEIAIKKLADGNIPMKEISVIGKGYHSEEKVVGFYNTGDRMKFWGKYGAFWGGLWGILVGGLYVTVPVVGPVVVLGHFAAMVVAGLEGAVAVGGLSALGAGLFGLGIPKDTVLQYEQALKSDSFLILVQGSAQETERARDILKASNAKRVDMHHALDTHTNEADTLKTRIAG